MPSVRYKLFFMLRMQLIPRAIHEYMIFNRLIFVPNMWSDIDFLIYKFNASHHRGNNGNCLFKADSIDKIQYL